MVRTPESKVKAKVVKALKELGAYYFFPIASPIYGSRGAPDIVCCIGGRFVAVECKAGYNKVTELQQRNLDQIKQAGGVALICNEQTVQHVISALQLLGAVLGKHHAGKSYRRDPGDA
jgi:Holliday junction resolvase